MRKPPTFVPRPEAARVASSALRQLGPLFLKFQYYLRTEGRSDFKYGDELLGRLSNLTGYTAWYLRPLLNFTWGSQFSATVGVDIPLSIDNRGAKRAGLPAAWRGFLAVLNRANLGNKDFSRPWGTFAQPTLLILGLLKISWKAPFTEL